jgi:hypothetical protein
MDEWIGTDRRVSERLETEERFRCFVAGRRFQGKTLNISAGGCLLIVDRIVKTGSIIVLEQIRTAYGYNPPLLIGKVIHFRFAPEMGAGVKWVKIVSEDGIGTLREFIRERLDVDVPMAELRRLKVEERGQPISYDFEEQRLTFEKSRTKSSEDRLVSMLGIKVSERAIDRLGLADVRIVQSEAPKQKRALLREDDNLKGRVSGQLNAEQEAKRLEEWLRLKKAGQPIEADIVAAFDGNNVSACVTSVTINSMFIEAKQRLPEVGNRMLIRFPIRLAKARFQIVIVTEVQRMLSNSSGGFGASVKIITINEGDNPGCFKRYVETL